MKKKYHYKTDGYYIAVCVTIMSAIFVPIVLIQTELEFVEKHMAALYILWVVLSVAIPTVLGYMPASFEADEKSVTFHLLFQKKIYIPYSSILSIEVTREYDEPFTIHGRPEYVEYLRIDCEDIEYNFDAPMKIDLNETANHPEKLEEQFEQGMFWCLKTYIESHM